MDINRLLYSNMKGKLEKGRVLVLYGPRRVGKTYLIEKLMQDPDFADETISFHQGGSGVVAENLSSKNPSQLISFIGEKTTLLIIDEAQKIPEIGENLKLFTDNFPNLKIIATGSASFELASQVGEPLTGRKKTLLLYPISASDLIATGGQQYYLERFDQHLIYGGYPEVLQQPVLNEKKEYLMELLDSYLFRDILELEKVRNSRKLRDLLTLIAFQIGKEVSLTELGNSLDLHKNTVFRYLDLMEKAFILVNVRGFSRNLRKEVYKNSRWYFWDNGVRNALINNFNPLKLRNDVGELWENYLAIERLKKQSYALIISNNYFWRTYDQKEIDWVEEREGRLYGYEFAWSEGKKRKPPSDWLKTYSNASYEVMTRKNYLQFIA